VVDRSYTIWFSQRVGSTWFAGMLEDTGIAGVPREYLNVPDGQSVFELYHASTSEGLVTRVHAAGTGSNGVFGIKHSYHQPAFDRLLDALVPTWRRDAGARARLAAWEEAFPGHRHIFLTRRNKVRLAVSWWRAIQTAEWHRTHASPYPSPPEPSPDLRDAYDFWAIDHLVDEATMREAGIAELLAHSSVPPLTLTYEDVVLAPETALRQALDHLGLPARDLPASRLTRMADELSEDWVQRYRKKKQKKWPHRGW
jgi:LPS sulfotransferase NodH